jgi:hypothetical protein
MAIASSAEPSARVAALLSAARPRLTQSLAR